MAAQSTKESASKVVGLDYYKEGVEEIRKKGFDVIYGDAQNFSLNEKYEVITAGDLIEHLPNLEGFISCLKKHLSPDGKVIISTPNPWCWKYMMAHLLKPKMSAVNKEHVFWLCHQTLENLFARYDLEIFELKYHSRRWWEKIIPLPGHIKHTTINVALKIKS